MDYKFRTSDKQTFLNDIAKLGFDITQVSQESIEQGYYQDANFTVKWLGELTIGQEWDSEGNIINEGETIEGEFVDMRTVNALPDGFEEAFENTVIDNRYPHAFS
jgi:hypothetical protein